MGDTNELDIMGLIKEARKNVEEKEKKEGKKSIMADGITKTTKAIDVWTPMNVFRFLLAGVLVVVKLGLTSSVALVNVSWWLVLLPAYLLEGVVVAALLAMGLLSVLYLAVMAIWTAFQVLILDPIQSRRFKNKVDGATHSEINEDPRDDLLKDIHRAMMQRDGQESH